MKFIGFVGVIILFLLVSGFKGCYEPVTNTGLPKNVKVVAVPPFQFEGRGIRYKVSTRFTEAVVKEVIRRGRGLRVQGDVEGAQAVIEGTIKDFTFSGVLLDREGRARVYEVAITAAVTVRDNVENKVLYDNQNYIFRDSFEFTSDPRSFFNEEDPAVERMARAFAESVVSTLVNGLGVKEERK